MCAPGRFALGRIALKPTSATLSRRDTQRHNELLEKPGTPASPWRMCRNRSGREDRVGRLRTGQETPASLLLAVRRCVTSRCPGCGRDCSDGRKIRLHHAGAVLAGAGRRSRRSSQEGTTALVDNRPREAARSAQEARTALWGADTTANGDDTQAAGQDRKAGERREPAVTAEQRKTPPPENHKPRRKRPVLGEARSSVKRSGSEESQRSVWPLSTRRCPASDPTVVLTG